jgi:hypothetical protein
MLYDLVRKYLLENYAVIYGAESNLHSLRYKMKKSGINVQHYLESEGLTIVDRNLIYSPKIDVDNWKLVEAWQHLINRLDRRSKFKGVLAIGMPISLYNRSRQIEKLLKYEKMLGKSFDKPLEAICCYTFGFLAKLPLKYLITVFESHRCILHDRLAYHDITQDRIYKLVENAIRKTLGNSVCGLTLKTLKDSYNIDKNTLVSNPYIFEECLGKMLGSSCSAIVVQAVVSEIRREFGSNSNICSDDPAVN